MNLNSISDQHINLNSNQPEQIERIDLSSKGIDDNHNIFQQLIQTYPNVKELNLSNNKLTSLPSNLTSLASLERLDLRGNPLSNFNQIVASLATFPKLSHLKIDIVDKAQEFLLKQHLSHLFSINSKVIKEATNESNRIDLEDQETEMIRLDNERPLFSSLSKSILEKLNSLNKEIGESFLKNFDLVLRTEVNKLNQYSGDDNPNYLYATYVIESVITVLNYFNCSFSAYMDVKDNEASELMKKVNSQYYTMTKKLIGIMLRLHKKIEEKTVFVPNAKLFGNMDEAIEINNVKVKDNDAALAIIKQYQDEIRLLKMKIERLENENKIMTSKLLNNAQTIINRNSNENFKQEHKSAQVLLHNNDSNSNSVMSPPQLILKKNKTVGVIINNNNNSQSQIINSNSPTSKVFTIKMMKDIITDLYNSKEHFNTLCDQNSLPRETMEQHMYTHFNQKFGLKSIIIEYVTNIINGIRAFSSEDSEICLFGKILRNELEEDSRHFLPLLKSRINERLTFSLRNKYSLKSNGDINAILQKMITSNLPEDEWRTVIYSLYEEADAKVLEKRFIEIITANNNMSRSLAEQDIHNKKLSREEIMQLGQQKDDTSILYKDLIQVLHEFQIKSREKYLKRFVKCFKKIDKDNNGIVNEEEFIKLVTAFNIYPQETLDNNINRLLALIDPNNNKQITFSECITLFTLEVIEHNDKDKDKDKGTITILDKICLD